MCYSGDTVGIVSAVDCQQELAPRSLLSPVRPFHQSQRCPSCSYLFSSTFFPILLLLSSPYRSAQGMTEPRVSPDTVQLRTSAAVGVPGARRASPAILEYCPSTPSTLSKLVRDVMVALPCDTSCSCSPLHVFAVAHVVPRNVLSSNCTRSAALLSGDTRSVFSLFSCTRSVSSLLRLHT